MRLALALLLAIGPTPVEALEPVFDPLSHLLNQYAGPVDESAAEAPPDAAGPPGTKLAQVQSDLILMAEGLETFRHPSHTVQALKNLPDTIIPELKPYFKNRDASLDTIYRTLAVTDYTWALRFAEPNCDPKARRKVLLSSKDGLFVDPKTGALSVWLARLLGATAYDRGAEDALDKASNKQKLSNRDYELLRLKVRKITEALNSDKAVGSARSRLYCARAQVYQDLSSAHRTSGHVMAGHAIGPDETSVFEREASSVLLMAIVGENKKYRAIGAGVLVKTSRGNRVLTDARLLSEGGKSDDLAAFVRPKDGRNLGEPLKFTLDKVDPRTGVAVGRLEGGDDVPALRIAEGSVAQHEFLGAIGHSGGAGAWTISQGLVTATGSGTFTSDAALGPDMLGSPLLNDRGEVVGLLVLREDADWPSAVMPDPLREVVEGDSQMDASSDIKFVYGKSQGSASIISTAMPLIGAGLVGPGGVPIEAALPMRSGGVNWGGGGGVGNWRPRSSAGPPSGYRSNSGSSSSGSSSAAATGAAIGQDLGQALAPLVEALIFKGIPALFRKIGAVFTKPKTAPAQQFPRGKTREAAQTATKPKQPKEPVRLMGITLEASPALAASGEKVTLKARVSLSDPEAVKAGIVVSFKGTPGSLLIFDGKPQAKTDGLGVAAIIVTLRRDHGVRKIETGDIKAVKGKFDSAQSELDEEVRAMNASFAGAAGPEIETENDEDINIEAWANLGKSVSATALLVLSGGSIEAYEIDTSVVISVTNNRVNASAIDSVLRAKRNHIFVSAQAYSELAVDPRNLATLDTYGIVPVGPLTPAVAELILPAMISAGLESPGDAEISASALHNKRRLITQDGDFLKGVPLGLKLWKFDPKSNLPPIRIP